MEKSDQKHHVRWWWEKTMSSCHMHKISDRLCENFCQNNIFVYFHLIFCRVSAFFSASAKELFYLKKTLYSSVTAAASRQLLKYQTLAHRMFSWAVLLFRCRAVWRGEDLHSLTEWRCHFTAGDLWLRWGEKLHRTSVRLETFWSDQMWCGRGGFPARLLGGRGGWDFSQSDVTSRSRLVHRLERFNHHVDREGRRTLTASPSESRHQE